LNQLSRYESSLCDIRTDIEYCTFIRNTWQSSGEVGLQDIAGVFNVKPRFSEGRLQQYIRKGILNGTYDPGTKRFTFNQEIAVSQPQFRIRDIDKSVYVFAW
jgi:hypothetical protein